MSLKTLKDMRRFCKSSISNGTIDYDDLREEVIKWIKELDNITDDGSWNIGGLEGFEDNTPHEGCSESIPIIGFIKHFFNITEEDLK